jgi:SH3-like domain-containing protein
MIRQRSDRRRLLGAVALAAALVAAAPAGAAAPPDKSADLPRFGTLRADKVNLRVGPGNQYPIQWVFTRKGLPVEIIGEVDVWRRIRDAEGTEGWVHEHMVTGNRSIVVDGEVRTLRAEPGATATAVARAEPGVIAHLLECRGPWCRVEADGIKGWLQRSEVWGVTATETVP